ncbi:MAG TPA: hypothetical protein VNT42_10545 [Sphingomonas sp.]|nr:hypothetical protein [Sphingomonas sp.]
MTRAFILAVGLLLAGCGNQQTLRPPEGAALPPKPASAPVAPTPAQLLTPSAQTRPGRSDELLTKSQQRADDPFDQPPQ